MSQNVTTTRQTLIKEDAPVLFSEGTINLLIQDLMLEPICQSNRPQSTKSNESLWVSISTQLYNEIVQASNVPKNRLNNDAFPKFHVKLRPEGLSTLEESGVIYGLERPLYKNYYLSLLDDGRLFVKYQNIIGSRFIGQLDEKDIESFKSKAAGLIGLRDRDAQALFKARDAKEIMQSAEKSNGARP